MDITQLLGKKRATRKFSTNVENAVKSEEQQRRTNRFKVYGSHMISSLPSRKDFQEYYNREMKNEKYIIKVAAFDMDDTIICSRSGMKFGRGPHDWKWRTGTVVSLLQRKVNENYIIAVFTNQASISVTETSVAVSKSYRNFTAKVSEILSTLNSSLNGAPVLVFAASGRPGKSSKIRSSEAEHLHMRKPATGMWEALELFIADALGPEYFVDKEKSFYVGDAAGRDGDHLLDDLNFAKNVGLTFQIPEDFFGE